VKEASQASSGVEEFIREETTFKNDNFKYILVNRGQAVLEVLKNFAQSHFMDEKGLPGIVRPLVSFALPIYGSGKHTFWIVL
jgi:hypothetical protein